MKATSEPRMASGFPRKRAGTRRSGPSPLHRWRDRCRIRRSCESLRSRVSQEYFFRVHSETKELITGNWANSKKIFISSYRRCAPSDKKVSSKIRQTIQQLAEFLGAKEVVYTARGPSAWKNFLR